MLPLPRTRKRLAAPFFVFILCRASSLSSSFAPGGSLRELLKPRLSLVPSMLLRVLLLLLLILVSACRAFVCWLSPSLLPAAPFSSAPAPSPSPGLRASGTARPGRPHPDLFSRAPAAGRRTPGAPSRGHRTATAPSPCRPPRGRRSACRPCSFSL